MKLTIGESINLNHVYGWIAIIIVIVLIGAFIYVEVVTHPPYTYYYEVELTNGNTFKIYITKTYKVGDGYKFRHPYDNFPCRVVVGNKIYPSTAIKSMKLLNPRTKP